jgi:hypothetical protein
MGAIAMTITTSKDMFSFTPADSQQPAQPLFGGSS